MAHQTVNPQGVLVDFGMLAGNAFDGHRMQDPTWAQPIPGYAFDVRGAGRHFLLRKTAPAYGVAGVPTLGRVGKFHGALDVDMTVGGVVPCTLASLADSGSPTALAELSLTAASRILFSVTDELGTIRAAGTSSVALTSGRRRVRLVYSSQRPLWMGRHAVLLIDGAVDPVTWTVDPLASWSPFSPRWLFAGFRPGAPAFGGTVHRVQVGNQPVY